MLRFVIVLPFLLVGCSAPPIQSEVTTGGVTTSLIAEVDGCRLWAIDRGGMTRTVFMARCPEGAADVQSSYSVQNGKILTTYDQQTVGAK